MAKGKTISITLPLKVVELYENKAKEVGTSRSAIIGTIILADYELKQNQERIANVAASNPQTEETE